MALPGAGRIAATRHDLLLKLEQDLLGLPETERTQTLTAIVETMRQGGEDPILVASFLFTLTGSVQHGLDLIALISDTRLPWERRRRLYWQMYSALFRRSGGSSPEVRHRLVAFYRSLHEEFLQRVDWHPAATPGGFSDAVVVFVNQLLNPLHAPTADTLNLIGLLRQQGRTPVLINTDDLPHEHILDFFKPFVANREAGMDPAQVIDLGGSGPTPFRQCRNVCNDISEARSLLDAVADLRPGLVLNLGHSSHIADACRSFAPVVTIPFTAEVAASLGGAAVLYAPPNAEDTALLALLGLEADDLLLESYTYCPPQRSRAWSRSQLGLPDDAYLLTVVGTRLSDEMDGDACAKISHLFKHEPAARLVVIGSWPSLPNIVANRPDWSGRCLSLGYRTDLADVLACCDGFYNPRRQGGGTSVAWALALGLQVFSERMGDGFRVAGEERVPTDGAALVAAVQAYRLDPVFRADCQAKARARFAERTDRAGLVRRILAFGERLTARRAASG